MMAKANCDHEPKDRGPDRRGTDRRTRNEPLAAPERRVAHRRSGYDRRDG